MQVSSPAFGWSLVQFLLGYAVILATPGPNLLVIGSMAASQGLRGAVPLCLGVALGAGALSAFLLAAFSSAPAGGSWQTAGRLLGILLLLWVAMKVALQRPGGADAEPSRGSALAEFAAGFCTAVTNPLTAAFFAAQFLGPLSSGGALRVLAPVSVMAAALLFFLAVASLLARPFLRRATLAWHRPICLAASMVLVVMAASMLNRLIG